jgi:hypothetical protein
MRAEISQKKQQEWQNAKLCNMDKIGRGWYYWPAIDVLHRHLAFCPPEACQIMSKPTTSERELIRRYETCRRRFDRRYRTILTNARSNVCPRTMLLKRDDVLDALDEELVFLERRLPDWYECEARAER